MQMRDRAGCIARYAALLTAVVLTAGCMRQRLHEPTFLQAPYPQAQLWAVAPFINESGASQADGFRFADAVAHQVQDVHGINMIPVNRVIMAMRELDMPRITGPGDAMLLIRALGVDGIIVGTITAYDPYRPMTLGAAIELHMSPEAAAIMDGAAPTPAEEDDVDTRRLMRSPSAAERFSAGGFGSQPKNPVAQAAGIFDARNHRTLAQLGAYSNGREVPDSAYGRDIYLVSMDMYTQFVSFRLLHELLESERRRVAPEPIEVASSTR